MTFPKYREFRKRGMSGAEDQLKEREHGRDTKQLEKSLGKCKALV